MPKYRIGAVLLGGLFLASPAMAQSTNLAYATGEPRSESMVFLEKGNVLPESAVPMVSKASKAAKAGKTIHLLGRADQAEIEGGDDPRGCARECHHRGARAGEDVAQG